MSLLCDSLLAYTQGSFMLLSLLATQGTFMQLPGRPLREVLCNSLVATHGSFMTHWQATQGSFKHLPGRLHRGVLCDSLVGFTGEFYATPW